jgi:hypothetical protein
MLVVTFAPQLDGQFDLERGQSACSYGQYELGLPSGWAIGHSMSTASSHTFSACSCLPSGLRKMTSRDRFLARDECQKRPELGELKETEGNNGYRDSIDVPGGFRNDNRFVTRSRIRSDCHISCHFSTNMPSRISAVRNARRRAAKRSTLSAQLVPILPPIVREISRELDAQQGIRCCDSPDCKIRKSHVFRDADATTKGGLLITEMCVCKRMDGSNVTYAIMSSEIDQLDGVPAVSAHGSTIAEAWAAWLHGMATIGECGNCGIILKCEDSKFSCEPCALRAAMGPAAMEECCVCLEDRSNIYHLRCGHRMCYRCARQLLDRRCPQCRRVYRLDQSLRELSENEGAEGDEMPALSD